MVPPVRATPSQLVELERSVREEAEGSYPDEITRDQFVWLQERAAARRQRWAEHAATVARTQKS
jgi:hypothetical protein